MTALLAIDHASRMFGGLVAVNDVSFAVTEGELVGLIGPNGSGKTTLLNIISGALRPSAGAIVFEGAAITAWPAHRIARAGIARTFQLVRILPSLSALENVAAGALFGRVRRGEAVARKLARDLLERVGIGDRAAMSPAAMTYIDQKRLELARALALEPRLLLLDEWLAGLNPSELRIGISLIRDLRNEGRTIIMVEHVMDAIRSLCDRCLVMSSGALIADGAVADVLAQPEVVAAYLGDEHA
jgi:branched-chain amino acid transport system ATP-binding protein